LKNLLPVRLTDLFVVFLTLLLCACASNHPELSILSPAKTPSESASAQANDSKNDSKPVEEKVFTNTQVIVPGQDIVKNGLAISYSMKTLHEGSGYLVQLTLIFRNLQNHQLIVRPKVYLTNAKGAPVGKFAKKEFLQLAHQMMKRSSQGASSPVNTQAQRAAQDKIEWANAYWLKPQHSISSGGIEIAGLVYHCNDLSLPMTLTIHAGREKFVFNIKEMQVQNEPQ
jgi:hypothetical protein